MLAGKRVRRLLCGNVVWESDAPLLPDGQRTQTHGSLGGATLITRRRHVGRSIRSAATGWPSDIVDY